METNEKEQIKENPLASASVIKLIAKFAIPSIISMLVIALYNITDQIFIGNIVGMLGNAATNVAFPMVSVSLAFAQVIGIGAAANFSISMGAKKEEEAKEFVGNGITLMILVGLLVMVVTLILKTPILLLCGATESVLPYADKYLGITAIGIPFLIFGNAMTTIIRADGSPKYSMIATISGVIINIFLDWLFMVIFNWEIEGAAIATVIGQFITVLIALVYLPRFKSFKIEWEMLKLRIKYINCIIKLGLANFINHIIMGIINVVLNNVLTKYGANSIYGSDIPLAVSGIVAKLNAILIAVSVGLAQGCQPILGFNMGAKNYNRVKETFKKACVLALIIGFVTLAIFQIFPRQITSIFGSGDELYFEFAEMYLRIYMMMIWAYSLQPLAVNYFSGVGAAKQGIFLSLSRQGFILLPLLLIMPLIFGLNGILYAGPIADVLGTTLALVLVALNFKKMPKQEKIEQKA